MCEEDGSIASIHDIPDSSAIRGQFSLLALLFFFLAVANLTRARLEGALEGRPIAVARPLFVIRVIRLF